MNRQKSLYYFRIKLTASLPAYLVQRRFLKQEKLLRNKMKSSVSFTRLADAVAMVMGFETDEIRKPSKRRMQALARGILCHLAIFEFGYLGSEVGNYLYLGSSGVSLAAKRGEKFLKDDKGLMRQIMDALEK